MTPAAGDRVRDIPGAGAAQTARPATTTGASFQRTSQRATTGPGRGRRGHGSERDELFAALDAWPRLMLHPASELVGRRLPWVLGTPPLNRRGVAPPAPARQPVPRPPIRRKPVPKTRFSAPRAPFPVRLSHHSNARGRLKPPEAGPFYAGTRFFSPGSRPGVGWRRLRQAFLRPVGAWEADRAVPPCSASKAGYWAGGVAGERRGCGCALRGV